MRMAAYCRVSTDGKPSWNPWKTKSGSLRILQKNKATNW